MRYQVKNKIHIPKTTLDKIINIVNNIEVGREDLALSNTKPSAVHPTVLVILMLLKVGQTLLVALLFCQP